MKSNSQSGFTKGRLESSQEAVLSSSAMDHPQLRYLTRPSSSSNPAQIPAYSEFAEMNRSQSSRPFSPAASLSQTPSQRGGVTAVVDRL
eukprot:1721040-Amphidinium_carterae.1